jgi:L-amino acid N-acyltransferase
MASIIRDATIGDLPAILAIYNQVIRTSTAVYSANEVDFAERAAWLEARTAAGYPVLVVEVAGEARGFGSFAQFRSWPGYALSVEHSVHVAEPWRGQGIGKELVEALVDRARASGKHAILGGIDADNAVSLKLHAKLGFFEAGRFPEVGRKFGRWLDLVLMQKLL